MDHGETHAKCRRRGSRRAVFRLRPPHDRRPRALGNRPSMAREYTKEAQQELMEKSLRNVRGLVDKIEAEEAARRRTQKWVIAAIVGVTLILIGLIGMMVARKDSGRPIVVSPPAQSAPAGGSPLGDSIKKQ